MPAGERRKRPAFGRPQDRGETLARDAHRRAHAGMAVDGMVDRQAQTLDAIVRVVLEILESEGYDAVQLAVVAKRARVSLTTIYKFCPTRDELIVTALSRWMQVNGYSGMADPPPDASLYEGMMWVYRKLFEPWERNPRMLEAYHRAWTGPRGERLDLQGMAAVEPVAEHSSRRSIRPTPKMSNSS